MNLLCEVPNSNILIRVPVPPEREKSVSDLSYYSDSLEHALNSAHENTWGYTFKQTYLTVLKLHLSCSFAIYDWLVVILRKITLLNDLPDTEVVKQTVGSDEIRNNWVWFCEETRIDLMEDRWGSKVTIIDYSELL